MHDRGIPDWGRKHGLEPLADAVRWDPLRHGVDSEVWRVVLSSGETLIAKRATGFEARESAVYHGLLEPLGVRHAMVYAAWRDDKAEILLIEDMGSETVESGPTALRYAEAGRVLADMRRKAAASLHVLPPAVRDAYYQSADNYLGSVQRVLQVASLDPPQRLALTRLRDTLPCCLERLYATACISLTHNDFNAKNLVVGSGGVAAIDWSHAELTPHLGDLYGLLKDAARHGVKEQDVVSAYLAGDPIAESAWHIDVGGLLWLTRGLRWAWEARGRVDGIRRLTGSLIRAITEGLDRIEE